MGSSYLPGVVQAKYVADYTLDVQFNDGTRKMIDISQWFKGPVFEPLRKKPYFKKFFVEAATVAVDKPPRAIRNQVSEGRDSILARHRSCSIADGFAGYIEKALLPGLFP